MSNLSKVRVQLLDETTGAVVEEVDVLTSANAVTFADGQTFQQKLDAGVLKGAKGDTGAKGDKGDTGATGTQGIQGLKGDTGVQGPAGPAGAPGVKGADGKTWHISAVVPATSLGAIGDMHLNTATFDIREKTAAAVWTVRGNIKGATGATGVQGIQGSQGPKGEAGAQGLKGDPGANGATGAKGDKGDTGATGPKGVDGDNVKFGATLATATDVKMFLKKM